MPLTTKSLQELEALLRAGYRNFIPEADVSTLSDYDIAVRIYAALFLGNQEQAAFVVKQYFPSQADADNLDLHKKDLALPDRPAQAAGGVTLVTGTISAGDFQPAASALTSGDGVAYTLDAGVITALATWSGKTVGDSSGIKRLIIAPNISGMVTGDVFTVGGVTRAIKAVISSVNAIDLYEALPVAPTVGGVVAPAIGIVAAVTADEVGTAGNKPTGDTLTLTSPVGNIDADTKVLEVGGGRNDQTPEELRRQVLDKLGGPDGQGSVEDYRRTAKETPAVGVSEAFVYPGLRGLSTVDVLCVGVPGARILSTRDLTAIATHLSGLSPGSDDILVLTALLVGTTDVDVTVDVGEGFEADWSGSFTTMAGSSTTALAVTSDPRGIIEVGDRLQISTVLGGVRRTEVREVNAVAVSAIQLTAALQAAPLTGETILPAGPSTAALLTALYDYFDRLGPGILTATGDAPRHPDPADSGDFRVRRAAIIQTLMNVEGTINVPTLTTPAGDLNVVAQAVITPTIISIRYT